MLLKSMVNRKIWSEIGYFILYYIITTDDPCVGYCQNLGNCTSKLEYWNKNYKVTCECTREYTGDHCEIPVRKWPFFEFHFHHILCVEYRSILHKL